MDTSADAIDILYRTALAQQYPMENKPPLGTHHKGSVLRDFPLLLCPVLSSPAGSIIISRRRFDLLPYMLYHPTAEQNEATLTLFEPVRETP